MLTRTFCNVSHCLGEISGFFFVSRNCKCEEKTDSMHDNRIMKQIIAVSLPTNGNFNWILPGLFFFFGKLRRNSVWMKYDDVTRIWWEQARLRVWECWCLTEHMKFWNCLSCCEDINDPAKGCHQNQSESQVPLTEGFGKFYLLPSSVDFDAFVFNGKVFNSHKKITNVWIRKFDVAIQVGIWKWRFSLLFFQHSASLLSTRTMGIGQNVAAYSCFGLHCVPAFKLLKQGTFWSFQTQPFFFQQNACEWGTLGQTDPKGKPVTSLCAGVGSQRKFWMGARAELLFVDQKAHPVLER